jgi:hypothetical protein
MPYVSESDYHELLLRDCEHDNMRATITDLTARLADAEAQMQAMTDAANDTWSMGAAEGERRATAAIVAWLRKLFRNEMALHLARIIEGGLYLKAPK